MSIDDATPRMWDRSNNGIASKPYANPCNQPPEADNVNHPAHYNNGKIECIDYLEDNLGEGFQAYLEGNVKKYLHRYRHKGSEITDLRKARWYLDKLISTVVKVDS